MVLSTVLLRQLILFSGGWLFENNRSWRGLCRLSNCCMFFRNGKYSCLGDVNENKVSGIKKGKMPIHEPGLAELVKSNLGSGRLCFCCQLTDVLKDTDILSVWHRFGCTK